MARVKPTIRDVALRSNVSTATVSYVLNNRSSDVGGETRDRVLRAIRDLGYQPRALVRGERAAATQTIGIIFQNVGAGALINHPYTFSMLEGVLSVTTEQGWHVTLFTTHDWRDVPQNLRTFCDGRCDGLILAAPPTDCPVVAAVKERGMPFVVVNSHSHDASVSSVDSDHVAAMVELTQSLIERGHKKIVYLSGEAKLDNAALRCEGYAQAMRGAGLTSHVLTGGFYEISGYENAIACLDAPESERPTAICCGNDAVATGVYRALAERNVRVPEEMSVVGFDDMPCAAALTPTLTTVRQSFSQIGLLASQMLLRHILADDNGRNEPVKEIVPTQLIERDSVGKPRR